LSLTEIFEENNYLSPKTFEGTVPVPEAGANLG
jgi:hypothetical protein